MQAIKTTYLGPTNSRGARIKATASGGISVTVSYPYEANEGIDAHAVAALALARKLNWTGTLIGGALPGSDYAFVFAGSNSFPIGGGSRTMRVPQARGHTARGSGAMVSPLW